MNAIRLPILGLLVATAAAQAAPNRFIPNDAQLVLRIAAPTKWAAQFTNTKLGQVLGGEALAPILDQFREGLEQGFERTKAAGNAELIDDLFDEYTGDLTIALHVDLEDLPAASEEDRLPAMAIMIALSPDDSYDLPALAESLHTTIEEKNDGRLELREMIVGDYTLQVGVQSGGEVSSPHMIDDHLVMMFASDMERDGANMLSADNRRESAGSGKPLYVHIEAEQAISTLLDFVAEQMADDPMAPPIDVVQVLNDLGLGCLRNLDLSITADGDQVVMETNLGTSSENRGLFGSFVLDHASPRTLRYLPDSADSYACQAFDFGAVYRTIGDVWSSLDDIAPIAFEDVEIMFENATKVRLREDLIDHIDTEIIYLTDYAAADDLDPDDPTAFLAGSCYALSLRDGKAFGESLERALRSRGLHAARKSEDYQGVKVYRMRLAGAFEIEYAVTDDLLIVAPSSDDASRAQLRSILDARANPNTGIPEAIARHTDAVPSGWNGVGVTPVATLMSHIGDLMQQADLDDLPPEARAMLGMMATLGTEMKQAGIDQAVQFTYSSNNGIRTITRL